MARSSRSSSSYLVWEDVTVTLINGDGGSGKKKKKKLLVNGLTGFAESRRIMAVMGPSGSGKSTFLDALAGRLSPEAAMAGKVLLLRGGDEMVSSHVSCRDVSYVKQEDVLLGTLTVKETLYFGARLRRPELTKPELDDALAKMGLEECADNTVGNWHLRGISGGERRRLSIAVEIFAQPLVFCIDEATTGLDSAASFFVVQALRNIACDGKIVVCSIHQPTNDAFRLFDDLLLISSGEAVYFGESAAALRFFADSGFPCPARRNPPDHFLRCITPEFDHILSALKQTQRMINHPSDRTTAETIATLVENYKSSALADSARRRIRELAENFDYHADNVDGNGKRGGIGKQWSQFCTLTHRSSLHMRRDLGYYWLRIFFYIMVAISTGTLDFDIGTASDSVMARGKVHGFLCGIMICLSMGGLPFFLDEIKAFQGERQGGYYGEAAYVLSNFLSSLPFTVFISFSSGSILYNMVKFRRGFLHLLYFCTNLFFCISASEACVFVVASLVSNPLPAIGVAAGATVMNLMPSIALGPPPDLPKIFWRYPLSYVSYVVWGTQGNLKNDMMGVEFDSALPGLPKIAGEFVPKNAYGMNLRYSKWCDVAALFCLLVAYRLLLVFTLHYKQRMSSSSSLIRRIHHAKDRKHTAVQL